MILSVGCGTKLIPEVDVYLDLHPLDSKERKASPGMVEIPKNKKFVQGDVQNMHIFDNKEFDFVYAEHVLEHVDYPEAACHELQRVAKAGIIICPSILSELMFGWEYHKWLVLDRDKKLYFFSKRIEEHVPFGRFFREVIGKNKKYNDKIIPPIKNVYDKNKKIFNTTFGWKDNFVYKIIRERL